MADQSDRHAHDGLFDREAAFRARLAVLDNQLSDRASQPSSARAFLEALPVVKMEDFTDECHICKEPFFVTPGTEVTENAESALRLPCNHIFGADCLKTWFETNNTCPLCRTTLFGPSQEDPQISHTAISEWVTILRQQWEREQSEAITAAMRERANDLDLTQVLILEIRMGSLMARLDELNGAPDTEENRAAVSRIARRNSEITVELERIEGRIRDRERML